MTRITQTTSQGTSIVELQNEFLKVRLCGRGCSILEISYPDKEGSVDNIVAGYPDLEAYIQNKKHFGAFVGRVANRIKKGRFVLNGKEYQIPVNNGENSLHGGLEGFDQKEYDVSLIEDGVCFSRVSLDNEEGYPGNLQVKVSYRLIGKELRLEYDALSDADTIINLTNHCYFNLSGFKRNILDQVLEVCSSEVAELDNTLCPTGKHFGVADTPFDFRKPKPLKEALFRHHPQLEIGNGIDHPFKLDRMTDAIRLVDPISGRSMSVSSDLPYSQIYTANFLDGTTAGVHKNYEKWDAICFETEFIPDSIHCEADPKCILRKDVPFHSWTTWRFEVDEHEGK